MKIKYGWFMVGIGAFMTCIAIGAMFSLAVFLQPITQATGWSHTEVSSAMTIGFLAMGAAGFGWGALSDRIGPRYVVLAGAVLLGLGLFLASRAQSALQFQLAFGLLVGIAIGSFFTPMIAAVMGWMTEHRGLAVSLVSVGVGVAPMTMSPFAAWLVTQMDWRSAQLVLAVLVWATLIPAVAAGAFVFASRLGEFYAVAATFGFAYGGVMPLYAVLAREYFGQRILGAVFGAAAMVSSLGMALGPAVGGWIFDRFGGYTWLYIGSFAVGMGAVAIAVTFPPFRRQEQLRPTPP